MKRKRLGIFLSVLLILFMMQTGAYSVWADSGGLEWESCSLDNPLGGARQFNLFSLGDVTDVVDIEGAAAIGGNLTIKDQSSFTVGAKSAEQGYAPTDKMLIVKNAIDNGSKWVTVKNGGAVLGQKAENINIDNKSYTVKLLNTESYFNQAAKDLCALNNKLYNDYGQYKASVIRKDNNLILKGSNKVLNVFYVSIDDINNITDGHFKMDVDPAATNVINIEGQGVVTWHPNGVFASSNLQTASKTFLNFSPAISTINFANNHEVYGNFIAPQAKLVISEGSTGTHIIGNVVVNGIDNPLHNGFECHLNMSIGSLPEVKPDKPSVGSVRIVKVNDSDQPLEGVTFQLKDFEGNVVKDSQKKTNERGEIVWNDLPYGKYKVEEVEPLPGYKPCSKPIEVVVGKELTKCSNNIIIVNERIKGSIELTKTGENDAVLPGAVFALNSQGSIIEDTIKTTGEDGKIKWDNLEMGNYEVVEIAAPEGYTTAAAIKVKLSDNQYSNELIVKDDKIDIPQTTSGCIKVVKCDENDQPIEGVSFKLSKDQQVIAEGTTNKEGILLFENLDEGEYTLIETAVPDGYIISTEKYALSVVNGVTLEEKIVNKKIPEEQKSVLKIIKNDESQQPLAGASFYLKDKEGNILEEVGPTDANGVIELNIKAGDYIVSEIKAPEGYILSAPDQSITLTENGGTLTFIDKKESTPTPSPSNTPSPSPTSTPTVTPSPSPTSTPTVTPSPSPTSTPTITPSPSPSNTPSPSRTPSDDDDDDTPSPSRTPSHSDTPSPSKTPSHSDTPSPSRTPSHSDTPSPSRTPSHSDTPSPSRIPLYSPSVPEEIYPIDDEIPSAMPEATEINSIEQPETYETGMEQAGNALPKTGGVAAELVIAAGAAAMLIGEKLKRKNK